MKSKKIPPTGVRVLNVKDFANVINEATRFNRDLHGYAPNQYRHAPEFGGGGIFGLAYDQQNKALIFTRTYEGVVEIRNLKRDVYHLYRPWDHGGLRSGGDVYNAVTQIAWGLNIFHRTIFLAGYANDPVIYNEENNKISYRSRGVYLAFYDTELHDTLAELYHDSLYDDDRYAGIISDIIYDAVNNGLYLCRGDGHDHLGVWFYNFDTWTIEPYILTEPALKGTIYLDWAVFNKGGKNFEGIQFIKLSDRSDKGEVSYSNVYAKDGGDVPTSPEIGGMFSIDEDLFITVKGGMYVGRPMDGINIHSSFIRLFYGVNLLKPIHYAPFNGGYLVPYSYIYHSTNKPESYRGILVFVDRKNIKIVHAGGAITSICPMGGEGMLIATNTCSSKGRLTLVDLGDKTIQFLPNEYLLRDRSPPCNFSKNGIVPNEYWGGFPLMGYYKPYISLYASKPNVIKIYEYDITYPEVNETLYETYNIETGKNIIDLSGFGNAVVSFSFEESDGNAKIYVSLR